MTSHSSSTPWDFTEALDLLHSFTQQPQPREITDHVPDFSLSPRSSISESLSGSPKRRPTLGNFDRVFRKFSRRIAIESLDTKGGIPDESSSASDDETTPPTTPLDCDAQNLESLVSAKEVRWTDQVEDTAGKDSPNSIRSLESLLVQRILSSNSLTRLTASGELVTGDNAQKTLDDAKHQRHRRLKSQKSDAKVINGAIAFESEADAKGANWWLEKSQYEMSKDVIEDTVNFVSAPVLPSAKQFVPMWVTPFKRRSKLRQSPVSNDPKTITPILYLTRQEKIARLIRRLGEKLGCNLLLPMPLSQYGGMTADDGIHVFVDSSNIAIGFYDALKLARGLPVSSHMKFSPFSFHSLALIMERGRGVAKRVLVGSSDRHGIPEYMREAARCGYEVNSLDRVEKFKEIRSTGRKTRVANGYGTSGQSSGSETQMSHVKKVTEQGVDEILHMKILESIVDSKHPSTIVLATGDAAKAEYSEGFLKNVERALNKGWKVELVAWGHSMSYAYRSRNFLNKWTDQFMILDLDNFSEELLGVYVEPSYDSDVEYATSGVAINGDFVSNVEAMCR